MGMANRSVPNLCGSVNINNTQFLAFRLENGSISLVRENTEVGARSPLGVFTREELRKLRELINKALR